MRRLLLRPLVYNAHISQELGVARRFHLRVAARSRARRRSPSSRCRSRLPGILSMFVDRRGYEGPEFTAEGRHHRELLYRHADQVCSGFYPDPNVEANSHAIGEIPSSGPPMGTAPILQLLRPRPRHGTFVSVHCHRRRRNRLSALLPGGDRLRPLQQHVTALGIWGCTPCTHTRVEISNY